MPEWVLSWKLYNFAPINYMFVQFTYIIQLCLIFFMSKFSRKKWKFYFFSGIGWNIFKFWWGTNGHIWLVSWLGSGGGGVQLPKVREGCKKMSLLLDTKPFYESFFCVGMLQKWCKWLKNFKKKLWKIPLL